MNLRELAEGKLCQIRLPGCRFNTEYTVLAHFRVIDLSGLGFKAPDLCGAWACDRCHDYVDTHHDAETQRDFALGVFRTQRLILRNYPEVLIEHIKRLAA